MKTIQHAIALAAALMLMLLSTGTQVRAEMAQADEDMIEEVVTIDYFDIDVDDRLSVSSDFTLTEDDRKTLMGQGIDASDISKFRFFHRRI